MLRSVSIGLLLLAACGPAAADDDGDEPEPCSMADVEARGALVDAERRECDPCPREASGVWITLETTCEPGVEWQGKTCFVDLYRVTNLATGEESFLDINECPLDNSNWRVAPGQPLEFSGEVTGELVDEPGEYQFVVDLLFELGTVEFEGTVE